MTDALDSRRVLSDDKYEFTYDNEGNRTASTSVGFRFGYTGRELDNETGLYYYRARYYDPSLGRFISEDPIGFGAGDTNLYRYVSNSPTNFTDPTGLLISGWAEDALYAADAFFAGFGNVVSFGITNQIRERAYGSLATDNHQGGWYNLGSVAGVFASLALNPSAAWAKGATWGKGAAGAYQKFGDAYGVFEGTKNILTGNGSAWDVLNFLPLAGTLKGAKGAGKATPSLSQSNNGSLGAAHIDSFSKEYPRYIYSDEALVDRARSLHTEFGYSGNRTLAVGRAKHHETGEYVTLYSSSTGSIKKNDIAEYLDSGAGEIAVNVNLTKFKADGFGVIDNIHQSHAELNMIQWAQKNGYIIEGIGVSHSGGICPHCYAQMVLRGITTSNPLYSDFSYFNPRRGIKIPALPTPTPKWWTPPKISFSSGNGMITIDPIAQSMTIKTDKIDSTINLNKL